MHAGNRPSVLLSSIIGVPRQITHKTGRSTVPRKVSTQFLFLILSVLTARYFVRTLHKITSQSSVYSREKQTVEESLVRQGCMQIVDVVQLLGLLVNLMVYNILL